jgi:predicted RecB family nuclease
MNHLITTESVIAYALCLRRAFFVLRGEPEGLRHEYECALDERAAGRRSRYLENLPGNELSSFQRNNTKGHLVRGFDPTRVVTAENLVAACDALIKKTSERGTGHARYEPHLVVGTHTVSKEHKMALAYAGYVVGQAKRYLPSAGFIVPADGRPRLIRLPPLYPTIRSVVGSLRQFANEPAMEAPPLSLAHKCATCAFHDHCLLEAEKTDSLTLLERMSPKLLRRYAKKGIFTVNQLSYLFKPRRHRKRSPAAQPSFNIELQALAVRTNKIYLHEPPVLAEQPVELYLDVEGIADQDFQYLIGLLVKNRDSITMRSFWADTPEDERRILTECVEAAKLFPEAPIYHYGSYEPRVFRNAATKHRIDCAAFMDRFVNVNSFIFGKIYFPTPSNRLKDLGAFVGASWSATDPSGLQSVAWRYRWEDTGDDKYKEMLLAYNQEDCWALRLLTKELQVLAEAAPTRCDVDFADRPKLNSTTVGEEIHCAFENILSSAHLDCRRKSIRFGPTSDRMSSSPRRRGAQKGHKANFRGPIKSGKAVHVRRSTRCPQHDGQPLTPTDNFTEHTVIDLAFTRRGCRTISVKYVGRKSHCPTCQKDYAPPAIRRLRGRLFGHGFQAWAVYQRVALHLPYRVIAQGIQDLFSEHVGTGTILKFMRNIADWYRHTETLIRRRILASPFVHADESTISIQGERYYVWVLTDGTHFIFYMTETREATALRKTLRSFEGVLVSDFFSGYDSMECRQQKCLVHLIRDLNDDLWKNLFSRQYESFVVAVRDLFVPILKDVGRYGLKVRHLQKHMKAVDRFYKQAINDKQYECEIVQKYQKRFVRYRESLFLFLVEDGIPWNNNMAERGLRHFAVQRKISGSFFKRASNDYLRLLGISQTCRFQGKPFLQFLLSGEKDIDGFKVPRRYRKTP